MKVTYYVKEEKDMELVMTLKNGIKIWKYEDIIKAIENAFLIGEFEKVDSYSRRVYRDKSVGTIFELDLNDEWPYSWNEWISILSKLK